MASPYLTADEVRARHPNHIGVDVDDQNITDLVAEFELIAETYRGVAFTDRGQDPTVYPGRPYLSPPTLVMRACAEYVSAVLRADRSGTSRDVIAQSFDGGVTRYSTPNWGAGRPTGFLEVDRLLNSMPDYRLPGAG